MVIKIPWTQYDYPNITNFYDAILYANDTTNTLFGTGLVFSIWCTFFIVFRRITKDDMASFASANFVTMTVASILWSVGLVDGSMILLLGLLTGVSVVFMGRKWYARA